MIAILTALVLIIASPCFAQQPPNCAVGGFTISPDSTIWVCAGASSTPVQIQTGGGSAVPAGSILLIDSGSCPAGYAEVAGLNGRTLIGTLAANANVGTTGGVDAITPTGTISAINQIINHAHAVTVTDPGHTHVERIINSGTAGAVGVQGASAASNANASNSPTASGTTGISAVTANPVGGVASITPTFTGAQFDNRSSFTRVIFCRKT